MWSGGVRGDGGGCEYISGVEFMTLLIAQQFLESWDAMEVHVSENHRLLAWVSSIELVHVLVKITEIYFVVVLIVRKLVFTNPVTG